MGRMSGPCHSVSFMLVWSKSRLASFSTEFWNFFSIFCCKPHSMLWHDDSYICPNRNRNKQHSNRQRTNRQSLCHCTIECPLGGYADELYNIHYQCKSCPTGQTTLSRESQSRSTCVCGAGYWNPASKSKTPDSAGKCSRKSYLFQSALGLWSVPVILKWLI